MDQCLCSEGKTIVNGKEEPTGLHVHDCGYIAVRNALISTAAKNVQSFLGYKSMMDAKDDALFTRLFFREMDRLYSLNGVEEHE